MANLSPERPDTSYPTLRVVNNKENKPMAIETVKTAAAPASTPAPSTKNKKTAVAAPVTAEPEAEATLLEMPAGKIADYLVDEIESFPLSALVGIDDAEHPLYDPRAEKLIASPEFVDSIKEHGQLEPGIVYPMGNGKYFVLAGHQRKLAIAAIGNGAKFKARRVKPEIGDLGAISVQVITNELRTNNTLEARGKAMARILKINGGNVKQVATWFNLTPQSVRNAMKLQEAAPQLRKAVQEGIIKETTAIQLITQSEGDKEKQIKAAQKAREMSVKLGDAKLATASKAKKAKPPKAITADQLLDRVRKPGNNLVREVVSTAKLGKEADTLAQWILGEIDSETMLNLIPAVRKIWNELEHAPIEITNPG